MANVPYNATPEVAPDVRVPDDYQHIHAGPESFGGLIAEGKARQAQGVERLGKGVEQTGENLFDIAKFQGKVNVDYEGNNYLESRNKILYGDPNKPRVGPDGLPVLGPDGKPQPDNGFLGLTGREASDKRAETLKQLTKLRDDGRANLKSPSEQLEYDNQTRRIYADAEAHIGSHVETQWKTWAGGVNDKSAAEALGGIARAPLDPVSVANHEKDLINFRVQQGQIKYGDDPTILRETIAQARSEALRMRLDAIAVNEPFRAERMAKDNQKILGTSYDEAVAKYRARADQQLGNTAATVAIETARTANGIEMPKTVQPAAVKSAILNQESGNRSGVGTSVDNAQGPGQILPATFNQYARPGESISNPNDNRAVSGRIIDDYMARYNGDAARVAVAYFSGPGNVSPQGSPNPWITDRHDGNGKSVSGYVGDVAARLGGNAGGPGQIKSNAYKLIMDNPDLRDNPVARSHAFTLASQEATRLEIAENQSSKAAKEQNDKAAGGYVTEMFDAMHKPNPDYVALAGRINHDTALDWRTKEQLMDRVKRMSGEEQSLAFGPSYLKAREGLFSVPDAPGHIGDFSTLVQDPGITTAGLADLRTRLSLVKGNVDRSATEKIVNSYLADAKRRLSFEAIDGPIKISDPKGEHIFHAEFTPTFIKRVSELQAEAEKTSDHAKLDKYLSRENVDKMISQARNPQQMALERMNATTGETEKVTPTPPPPRDLKVNPDAWNGIVSKPWVNSRGQVLTKPAVANALNILMRDPTPQMIEKFNKALGRDDGAEIVKTLGGPAQSAAPSANAAAADQEMKLSPQEKSLYERHLTNLHGPGGVDNPPSKDNPEGSRSTIFASTFEIDGKTYIIPTVWDGKILKPDDALAKARAEGLDKFPSYASEDEAEKRYKRLHDFMEQDTREHRLKNRKTEEPHSVPVQRLIESEADRKARNTDVNQYTRPGATVPALPTLQ